MEITVLGSGSFAPAKAGSAATLRHPSGYVVRAGKDILLFDFGFGNMMQLLRAGFDLADVSYVFLTHVHLDHIGDLSGLLFCFHYDEKPRSKRLSIYGPPGFRKFWARFQDAFRPWVEPAGYRLRVSEVSSGVVRPYRPAAGARSHAEGASGVVRPYRPAAGARSGRVRGEGWIVRAMPVPHHASAVAYRVESGGKSMCYSGDTGYDERLADFASGADLFILESSEPDSSPVAGHLTPSQAIDIASKSKCKTALLTHISERSEPDAHRAAGSADGFRAEVARDLMRIKL